MEGGYERGRGVAVWDVLEVFAVGCHHLLVCLGQYVFEGVEVLYHLDELQWVPHSEDRYGPYFLAVCAEPVGLFDGIVEGEGASLAE